jgi:ABC-type phosphate transport system substrate-binding protein
MRAAIVIAVVFATLAGIATSRAMAEEVQVRVIVNAKNPATKLSKEFVTDAFLKKRTRWSGDSIIHPVDLPQSHSTRAKFSRAVLGRDVGAVRRYWAQLVFSGRGVPPPEVTDEDAVIAYVAKNAGAIGYVSATATLSGVKTVPIE